MAIDDEEMPDLAIGLAKEEKRSVQKMMAPKQK
jgi:hypothetical protein